jgi:hypothetical protein
VTTTPFKFALLLLAAQVSLGVVGFAAGAAGLAWLGLPLLALLLWLLVRIAAVLRDEMEQAQKRKQPVVPWKLALFVTLLWQLPALVAVAPWGWVPDWAPGVWHGALLPFPQVLQPWWPAPVSYWLLGGTLVQAGLFAWLAGRPLARRVVPAATAAAQARDAVAAGQWAPARRHKDVAGRKNGHGPRVK